MQPDDDSQTTLSKWPFILGDTLLVATALAIAILGEWQLTNWQVAACVISVALGAALFVLPYVVEFQVRVREEADDRRADMRILQRQIQGTQDDLEAVSDRMESLESAVSALARAKPDMSEPLQLLEEQLNPLRDSMEAQSSNLLALKKALEAQAKVLEGKPDAGALESLEGQLARLKTMEADLGTLKTQVDAWPQELAQQMAAIAPKEATPLNAADAADTAETKARPSRAPRKRRHPESGLLKRAIEQKQDKSSAAVSRIIGAKRSESKVAEEVSKSEAAPKMAPKPKTSAKPEPVVDLEEAPEAIEESVQEPELPLPEIPQTKAEPLAEPPAEVKPVESPTAESTDEASRVARQKAEDLKGAPEDVEVAEPEDMFAESVPVEVTRRKRPKKSDTAVIASVFIGIGNKPYVRGNGAGLSWESGQAMEFEEIGKWSWVAPVDLEQPVEIQLYRNDEDADTTGKYTLEPGQKLDLSPVF